MFSIVTLNPEHATVDNRTGVAYSSLRQTPGYSRSNDPDSDFPSEVGGLDGDVYRRAKATAKDGVGIVSRIASMSFRIIDRKIYPFFLSTFHGTVPCAGKFGFHLHYE